ncbi:MAG: ribosome recycling factor [Candidatus Aureabacteria bacterium]|nr:ribosome recycling factor [Candidatus Auribacterota bacterium]
MELEQVMDEMELKMMKSMEVIEHEFATIRTGKASPALVENIMVDYYGTQTRLRQIAGISTPEPRLIIIQTWDPGAVDAVEKALMKSKIGITPIRDGRVLRMPIPELSEERRKELDKVLKGMAEEGRVAVRNVRREANDAIKKLQKGGAITEDQMHTAEKKVQDKTNEYIGEIDKFLAKKEKEIMEL